MRRYTLKRDKLRRLMSSRSEKRRRNLCLRFFETQNYRKRFCIMRKISRFSPNCSFTRIQNRCVITNNSHAVFRRFHMSRHTIKKLSCSRQIIGLYRRL